MTKITKRNNKYRTRAVTQKKTRHNKKTRKNLKHKQLVHHPHKKKFKHHFFKRVGHKFHGDKTVAGRAIASGGFGCVFSPELKCADKEDSHLTAYERHKRVSKVMMKRNAIEEYEEIQTIRKKLSNIPNYSKYFLVDGFTLCKIKGFSKLDLLNFRKGCRALKRDNIDETNINNPEILDQLLALNMINGGISVDEYIEKHIRNGITLKKMNDSLIDLLLNGIIPMNNTGVYHCDIKDSNILIDTKKQPRLIDWGLSTEYHPFKGTGFSEIPRTWYDRPLQYNTPFSVILFTDMFVSMYSEFLKKNGRASEDKLKEFLRNYIREWKKDRGLGHYELITHIVAILFSREINNDVMVNFNKSSSIKDSEESGEIVEEGTTKKEGKKRELLHIVKMNVNHIFTTNIIINYLYEILVEFDKRNALSGGRESETDYEETTKSMLINYLDNLFVEIVDVWGFITTYYPLLEYCYDHSQQLSSKMMELFDKLKFIFKEYLYKPRVASIDISDMVNNLKDLDQYFQ
jgi:hypothetical protein